MEKRRRQWPQLVDVDGCSVELGMGREKKME
jgi:hypothetical protein